MAKLIDIEGIGPTYAQTLEKAGLKTTEDLLTKGANPAGRKALAESTGIPEKQILGWVNRADLFRIKGVAEEYADLLEHCGVDTVPELAQRNPGNLAQKMTEVNQQKKLVRALPNETQLSEWVTQAKNLPRKIDY